MLEKTEPSWNPFLFQMTCLFCEQWTHLPYTLNKFSSSQGRGCIRQTMLLKDCLHGLTYSWPASSTWSLRPPPWAWIRYVGNPAGQHLTRPKWGTFGLKKSWWLLTRDTVTKTQTGSKAYINRRMQSRSEGRSPLGPQQS